MDLAINATRLLKDLDSLSEIGRTHDGGVTRTAFSEMDTSVRKR